LRHLILGRDGDKSAMNRRRLLERAAAMAYLSIGYPTWPTSALTSSGFRRVRPSDAAWQWRLV
jgi:hypothetical protein